MSGWSRRSFIASAGTLAVGGGSAAAAVGGTSRDVLLLRSYVAGAERHAGREALRGLTPGAALHLAREPENDYDARAVAVWTPEGRKLGYLPRIDNQALANLMDAGLAPHACIRHIKDAGRRPAIHIEVRLPLA